MIKAVIYDMDGVIIDSEPLWREVETEVFGRYGIVLTETMCRETTGLRVDEVVEYWFHRFPDHTGDAEILEKEIWDGIIKKVKEKGAAMPGVRESLEFFKGKGLVLALASTSAMVLIKAVLERLELAEYFSELHSAEFEELGKPHPGVYVTTAKKLEVRASHCVAIEDSINGMVAAKAAKMKCIAVPDDHHFSDPRYALADIKLRSLTEVGDEMWQAHF